MSQLPDIAVNVSRKMNAIVIIVVSISAHVVLNVDCTGRARNAAGLRASMKNANERFYLECESCNRIVCDPCMKEGEDMLIEGDATIDRESCRTCGTPN